MVPAFRGGADVPVHRSEDVLKLEYRAEQPGTATEAGDACAAPRRLSPARGQVRRAAIALGLAGMMALGACAGTGEAGNAPDDLADPSQALDPLEPMNRAIFSVNQGIDFWLLRPVATVYHDVLPTGVQNAVDNVLVNLGQPLVFANSLLQGDAENAGRAMGKFAANSFMGMGGIMDVAPDIAVRRTGFADTLGAWGIDSGAYLVLPVLGPSSVRDGIGLVVDAYTDPFDQIALHNDAPAFLIARGALTGVNARSQALGVLEELEATSVDFYASMRSLYMQRRAADIRAARGGAQVPEEALPRFD